MTKLAAHLNLGQWAEQQTLILLQAQGFQLIVANYHCRYGEIDLIVQQAQELVFVEVKARSVTQYAQSFESISFSKRRKIMKSALCFLHAHPELQTFYCRFDVICFDFLQQFAKTIQQDFSKFTYDQQWIENAFTFDEEFINL
ncbi:YraN family protein [Acinetobacter haemolyticus]|jgi:putative endonuclease|uniref:YraN family protein n=1 Tax=unclassified Acinetobacter TaxID=196816 RepID=UPI000A353A16|nr:MULTISPECIES: YraN family protein [unclassified Acinetobacter]MDD2945512.1 YraN family protein [Acinetobacter sp.]OTG74758.1 YraN family protein [Acinetobacter sp. ANC 4218]UDM37495.1 YraN family protein [Acinetobacter haemolyticus]